MFERMRRGVVFALASTLLLQTTVAAAHPDHHRRRPEEGPGRLPGKVEHVELVGKAIVGDATPDRIGDVAAFGTTAYLAAFQEPECQRGGVYVVDIADPAHPTEVTDAFIPAAEGSFVGEGVQVLDMATPAFTGQVLLSNNEPCADGGKGGLSLWNVTDPRAPVALAENVGDTTGFALDPETTTAVHDIHSAFGWNAGDRSYAVTVDNVEPGTRDIDIVDITDPRNPRLLVETGLASFPQARQDPPPNGNRAFFHDVVVEEVGGRMLMLASYWDAGYMILDVTDPATPKFLRDTDVAPREPYAAELGLPETATAFPAEGNAHQAEFTNDDALFFGADEDFDPYRTELAVAGGPTFPAINGGAAVPVMPDQPLAGQPAFVGTACDPPAAPPAEGVIALVERGGCSFQEKADVVSTAGYAGGIVFGGLAPLCDELITMAVETDIPFVFISRTAGLRLLNVVSGAPCVTPSPSGWPASAMRLSSVFDGWGYLHLYDATTMAEVDRFAIPEALDPEFARGFGDLSVHEVATDPAQSLAYFSYYSGGLRVLAYDASGVREVGAYVDPESGNNLWGIQVHEVAGEQLLLASDRDSGLWIFRYVP